MRSQANWKESLSKLIEGNLRFRMGLRSVESFASSLRLREFAENGQNPSAIILTCSDSRVPTEILFDKGVGDLFVIRVAGNVISRSIIASIEYAATVLSTPLCVVMGHTQCGAVRSALSAVHNEATPITSNIDRLLEKITPAVQEAIHKLPDGDTHSQLRMAGILNIQRQVDLIHKNSPLLSSLCAQEKLRIVGALYDLHDGDVSFDLEDMPNFKLEKPIAEAALNKMNFSMNAPEIL